jgi:Mg2+-importing ATPase
MATGLVVAATVALPYTPVAAVFGFVPLGLSYLVPVGAVVVLYIVTAEITKRAFYRRQRT